MFKRFCTGITVLTLLIFSSCSQDSVMSVEGGEEYSVETLADGTVLEQGSSINITLSEMGSRATLVRIILSDGDGTEIASTEVDPSLLKGLGLPMDLPEDLEDGVYTLNFTVLDGSEVLHEESRYLYVVSGVFEVESLETYPPGVGPGDSLSARATLNVASGYNPWIRWTLDGIVLKEGFLSDTGFLCIFEVPETEGIYSLKVELFPVEPGDHHFSAAFRQSDLFVDGNGGHEWQNSGDRVFRYFVDFSDALINKMAPEESPDIIGSPSVYHEGQMKGVRFTEADGLSFDRYALELLSGGRAQEFTLSMAFSFERLPDEGVYNIFSTGSDDSRFSFVYDASSGAGSGEFVCEFRSYFRTFRSQLASSRLEEGEVLYLDIQYEGSLGVAAINWMSRGELLVRDEGLPVASLEEGSTFVGAYGDLPGLPMVWYTLGVFTEADSSSALQADGFGMSAPEELLYESGDSVPDRISVGDIRLDEGLASLEVQSRSSAESTWNLKMTDADGVVLYTADSALNPGRGSLVLSLIYDERGLFISSSQDAAVMGPYDYSAPVSVDIIPDRDGGLADILAVRLFRD